MSDAADCAPLAAGVRVGAWRIAAVIERGPYVCRYLAEDGRRRVVIQELLPQAFARREGSAVQLRDAEDRNTLRWWLRNYLDKANALATLNRPGIARVLDAFEANDTGYAVLEHQAGDTLAERVRTRGALDWRDYLPALQPLLEALGDAHAQNLVLRDITPTQIVLGTDGRATLSGFGPLRGPVRFRAQTLHGTAPLAYAAPEELTAGGAIGPWTDVHGLAASSAFALYGRVPPEAARRATAPLQFELAIALPSTMRAVLEASLAAPAESRPGVATWLRALPSAGGSRAPATVAVSNAAVPKPAQRFVIGAIAVAAVAGIGAWFWLRAPAAPPETASIATPAAEASAPADNNAAAEPIVASAPDGNEVAPATATTLSEGEPASAAPPPVAAPATAATGKPATATPPAKAPPGAVAIAPVPAAVKPAATATEAVTATTAPVAAVAAAPAPAPAVVTPDKAAADAAAEKQRIAVAHAAQLQSEKAQCKTHVSDLLGGRAITYADLLTMKGVDKSADGRIKLSKIATDDGRKVSLLVDTHGCVLNVRIN